MYKSRGTLTARFGVEVGYFDVNTHKGYSPKTIKKVKGGENFSSLSYIGKQ